MFKTADGLGYRRFMKRLHMKYVFDWYLEVGCRDGSTFAGVRSKTIAVDPYFLAETNIIQAKPALHIFQQTSDDFFASGFLARNKIKLSVSFLDGMHLFEYLLRDFIAAERASDPNGVIMMHDTVPRDAIMTLRDFKSMPEGANAWTGDVWKIWPILQEYRPDLTLRMADCKPTGLIIVTGLDPKNRVLSNKYDEIIAKWQDIDILDYGPARFGDSFDFTDTAQMIEAGFPMFEAVQLGATSHKNPVFVSP